MPREYLEKLARSEVAYQDPNLGLRLDDYLLVDVIGRGGYGKVYLALQLPLLMKAALKLLIYEAEDESIQQDILAKFEGEALSLARLNHPNIVRMIKYGSFEGSPFLVMEFVERARTLKEAMDEQIRLGGGFEFRVVQHVIGQMLNALDCAHQQQIIHRDIKPENVMLQEVAGDSHFVRVVDFGMAKFVERRKSTQFIVGTPAYMAPEQIVKKNLGPWTDLYAVGVITLEMLLGMRLFLKGGTDDVLASKIDPHFDPLAGMSLEGLPEGACAFVRKSMAWSPAERFQSVAEFSDALNHAFEGFSRMPKTSIFLEDLKSLLDDSALHRLGAERQRLAAERAEFESQKRAIAAERESLDALRRQIESGSLASASQGAPKRQTAFWVVAGIVLTLLSGLLTFVIATHLKNRDDARERQSLKTLASISHAPTRNPLVKTPFSKATLPKKPPPTSTPTRPHTLGSDLRTNPLQPHPPPLKRDVHLSPARQNACKSACQLIVRCADHARQSPEQIATYKQRCVPTCLRASETDYAQLQNIARTLRSNPALCGQPSNDHPLPQTNTRLPHQPPQPGPDTVTPPSTQGVSCASICEHLVACYRKANVPVLDMVRSTCTTQCQNYQQMGSLQMYKMAIDMTCQALARQMGPQ